MNAAPKSTNEALTSDMQKLENRAFQFAAWAAGVLKDYHSVTPKLNESAAGPLRELYAWIFVPTTLWPFNILDVLADCLAILKKRKRLNQSHCLLIEFLPERPSPKVCAAVAEHEHNVQKGSYENLIKTQAKFDQTKLAISANPDLQSQWKRLKGEFDVGQFADHKGVIRRTMGAERNMRPTFSVDLEQPDEVFHAAFDAFCQRWNLYGMQHDEPLLLKLAVNVTPYGTMILIPSYWSFDPKRDIRWDAIASLHRTRVPGRQGSVLAEGKAERLGQARTLLQLDEEAKRLKLKGEVKHVFLCAGLGWVPETSPKRLTRLRALIE
jgi:hypothetical protein